MGVLEDQLKQWQKANAPKNAPTPAPLSKRSAKKKEPRFPPPQTIRRPEPPAAPAPRLLSDEELFAAAVKDVGDAAVLDKFGTTSAPASKSVAAAPKPPPQTEAELFVEFVGLNKKR